jgi:hypothetical protein
MVGGLPLTEAAEAKQSENVLQNIRNILKGRGQKPIATGDALRWYRDAIREMGKVTPSTLMGDSKMLGGDAFIGKMFFYQYDPKWKKVLPYYDTFPLVIPIEIYNDGWLGLNLHYLSNSERAVLFEKLLDFATDRKMNKATRLQVTYSMLKGVAKYKEHTPCIKRYLRTHVVSRVLKVDAPYWEIALYLPVERFKKQPKTKVWKMARR